MSRSFQKDKHNQKLNAAITQGEEMAKEELSVGEVSKRSGVAVSALHFYESKGLIKSTRNAGNHRRYKRSVLRKISVIKAAQRAGISLNDIVQQLDAIPNDDTVTNEDWQTLASQWKEDLDDRIERLQLLRDSLAYCIGCGCLSVNYCQLVNPEDKLSDKGAGPQLLEPDVAAETMSQFTEEDFTNFLNATDEQ